MDQTMLTVIFAAGSACLLIWGAIHLIAGRGGEGRKRIYQRLVSEGRLATETDKSFKAVRREAPIDGASAYLARLPGMMALHHAVEQIWPTVTLAKFLSLSLGFALFAGMLAGALFGSIFMGAAAGAAAGGIPFGVLRSRQTKRRRTMSEQLPEAMDFLGRVLRSGHSLSTALQMVGQELPDPLAGEFRRAYDAHSLGRTLEDALKEASLRVKSTDFGFFVTAVLIQRQTGGDLSEVLDNISGMIRGRLRLQQHVRAKTAEGRFTGYILTGFPIVMFFISYMLNPSYAGALLQGSGLYLLGTAAGLCILGLICIKRITTVKV